MKKTSQRRVFLCRGEWVSASHPDSCTHTSALGTFAELCFGDLTTHSLRAKAWSDETGFPFVLRLRVYAASLACNQCYLHSPVLLDLHCRPILQPRQRD